MYRLLLCAGLVFAGGFVATHAGDGPAAAEPREFPFEMARMPGGYFVARDPVTQAQYTEVTGENPSRFQEFADSLGATSLNELIEAAGAYCTLVLGRESFTLSTNRDEELKDNQATHQQ